MFPPQVPRVFIEWLTDPGDVVYDPFSGRGTAPVEACRLGRVGLGSDASPLAVVLTGAKVDPPETEQARARIAELRAEMPSRSRRRAPDEIAMLYAPRVLEQLLWLRSALSPSDRTDRFLLATLLGLMHANYEPGRPARGLSISMPNTFSLSPAYIRRYIDTHALAPPDVDVFEMLQRKIERMSLPGPVAARGRAWHADARRTSSLPARARLVFTSPPYLGVIQYGKYNWIRLWMLGEDPRQVDASLVATGSLSRYLAFLTDVLRACLPSLASDGFLCLVLGDVRKRGSDRVIHLAETVWRGAASPLGFRKLACVADVLPEQHKVSRIWGANRGRATKIDRMLILAPPGSRHDLPEAPRDIGWERPTWSGGLRVDHP